MNHQILNMLILNIIIRKQPKNMSKKLKEVIYVIDYMILMKEFNAFFPIINFLKKN